MMRKYLSHSCYFESRSIEEWTTQLGEIQRQSWLVYSETWPSFFRLCGKVVFSRKKKKKEIKEGQKESRGEKKSKNHFHERMKFSNRPKNTLCVVFMNPSVEGFRRQGTMRSRAGGKKVENYLAYPRKHGELVCVWSILRLLLKIKPDELLKIRFFLCDCLCVGKLIIRPFDV